MMLHHLACLRARGRQPKKLHRLLHACMSCPVSFHLAFLRARGRRLKKLHGLLHTRMARLDFFHFKEQTILLLCVLLAVHVALFVVSGAVWAKYGHEHSFKVINILTTTT